MALPIFAVGVSVLFGGCVLGKGEAYATVQNIQTDFVCVLILTCFAAGLKEPNGPVPVV